MGQNMQLLVYNSVITTLHCHLLVDDRDDPIMACAEVEVCRQQVTAQTG